MIQISPQMRILACTRPVDFRSGIDGLSRICRQVLDADPFSGTVFVFFNRRRTTIKLLCYDGQGFWLCQKRLSSGRLRTWPHQSQMDAHELQALIWNFQVPEGSVQFFKKLPR
jgi:transposase